MDRSDRERLQRLMEEAAALPPDDPARKRVEEDVGAEGSWAEEEWLELLRFDEKLRLRLQRIPVAPGLEAELLAIPERTPASRRLFVTPRWRAAAVVAALALVAMVASHVVPRRGESTALRDFALLAMAEHFEASTALTVESGDPNYLERSLAREIPFPVVVPDLREPLSLVGGQRCTLGARTVVYSRWSDGDARYSLYQFRPGEFGLPETVPPTTVPGETDRCRVLLWTEEGRGYALVGAP